MKHSVLTGVALGALVLINGATSRAVSVSLDLDFDGVASGSPVNASLPPGIRFDNAVYDYEYDGLGDPIPGTRRWRVDSTAPEVLVDNPDLYGRGAAPSPKNALEVLFQPVLLRLGGLTDSLVFRTTLDLDTYGDNGFLPGFEDIDIQFLGTGGVPLLSLPVDQTAPGFYAEAGPLNGVAEILFPAGAFYDDLSIQFDPRPSGLIPEPGTWLGAGAMTLVLGWSWRRSRRA